MKGKEKLKSDDWFVLQFVCNCLAKAFEKKQDICGKYSFLTKNSAIPFHIFSMGNNSKQFVPTEKMWKPYIKSTNIVGLLEAISAHLPRFECSSECR